MEVQIDVLAVFVLEFNSLPVRVVLDPDIVKLLAGNNAVNVDAAVGEESAHRALTASDLHFVVTVLRNLYLPCDGLGSLIPGISADCVVALVYRVRRADGVVSSVVCRIQGRGCCVVSVLCLDVTYILAAAECRSSVDLLLCGLDVRIAGQLLGVVELHALEVEVGLYTCERDFMLALGKVEEVRSIDKSVFILDRVCYPGVVLNLGRTLLVLLACVPADLSFVLPVAVKLYQLHLVERILSVDLHLDLDSGVGRGDGVIEHLEVVQTSGLNIELPCQSAFAVHPGYTLLFAVVVLELNIDVVALLELCNVNVYLFHRLCSVRISCYVLSVRVFVADNAQAVRVNGRGGR